LKNSPPVIFYLFRALLNLARPWHPLIVKRLSKSSRLSGTIEPRMMRQTIPPPEKPVIWLHAVSVGEVEAALPIARQLIAKYGANHLLFTTTTKEGWEVVQKKLDCLMHLQYYPFDFPVVVEKFLKHYRPSFYICMETELWPNMLYGLKRRGVPAILANGRISDRLSNTHFALRPLYRWIFLCFDWIGLQTDEDKKRLESFGLSSEKIDVVGNTKFDLPDPRDDPGTLESMKKEFGLVDGPIIVFGSTHPGEEDIIARTYKALKSRINDIAMVLAPRHIDRANEVALILKNHNISFRLRTESKNNMSPDKKIECLLLDTVGELSKVYALGEIAFVGGSLIKRGGHNLLEPAAAGVPVLHGPHMHNFRAITSFLHNAGSAVEVNDESELVKNIYELLTDHTKLEEMKRKARIAYESGKGATDKIMAKVEELMQ